MRFKVTLLALAVPAMLATGCFSEDVDPDTTEERRGAIGKADVTGTCTPDDCGGKGTGGNCWCDDLCDSYGDCCDNEKTVCDEACEPQLCEIACSNGFKLDENGCELCECKEPMCGGFAGIQCQPGFVCVDDPSDECDNNNGGADCSGICIVAQTCGGIANLQCPDDMHCEASCGGQPDCAGVCVPGAPPAEPNSCENSCNTQSQTGSCWCDDLCVTYGDCCDDVGVYCT